MSRTAEIKRKTNETDIKISINIDGKGVSNINTGVGFFDHMLTHLSKHSGIDINVQAKGDYEIDDHHTVEDVGIALGHCINEAIGDKKGIQRYGFSSVPMEDALADTAIDICGRPFCVYNATYATEKIGNFDVELIEEFIRAMVNNARLNLHVNVPYGTNSHHIAEATFKSLGQSLRKAVEIVSEDIPSTKGVL